MSRYKSRNNLIIGGIGVGKPMVITRMNAEQYQKFSAFCKQNSCEYHNVAMTLSGQYADFSCEKKVLEMFNSLYFSSVIRI